MSSDRETTRLIRAWLDEGVTALPDRVLDDVLDRVPATRQRRRRWWRMRDLDHMNSALAVGMAAAALVLLVTYLGATFFGPAPVGVGPSAPEPTASPGSSAQALPRGVGPLEAGTYSIDGVFPVRVEFDVPSGWFSCGQAPDEVALCGDARAELAFMRVDNVVADPCDPERAPLEPPVGGSVDDLAAAIANLDGFVASEPTDVTIGGFDGKRFRVTAPTAPGCDFGDSGLGTWSSVEWTNGVAPAERNEILILDVDGERVMVAGASHPTTPSSVRDQLTEMVDSIRLGP